MSLTDWLSRIADATGTKRSRLEDPRVLEDAVAELWLSGAAWVHEASVSAPPTLATPQVDFCGVKWQRSLISEVEYCDWGGDLPHSRTPTNTPAIGVPLGVARELAHSNGGRLPTIAEWESAVIGAAPGNHGLRWGGPTAAGVFPAAKSGLLDGWGNAWEWTEEGLAVGGSFASPPHPSPQQAPRLTSFRIVR